MACRARSGSHYPSRGRIEFLREISDARIGEPLRSIGPVSRPAAAAEEAADELQRRVVAVVDTLFSGTPRPPS